MKKYYLKVPKKLKKKEMVDKEFEIVVCEADLVDGDNHYFMEIRLSTEQTAYLDCLKTITSSPFTINEILNEHVLAALRLMRKFLK